MFSKKFGKFTDAFQPAVSIEMIGRKEKRTIRVPERLGRELYTLTLKGTSNTVAAQVTVLTFREIQFVTISVEEEKPVPKLISS